MKNKHFHNWVFFISSNLNIYKLVLKRKILFNTIIIFIKSILKTIDCVQDIQIVTTQIPENSHSGLQFWEIEHLKIYLGKHSQKENNISIQGLLELLLKARIEKGIWRILNFSLLYLTWDTRESNWTFGVLLDITRSTYKRNA